MVIKVKMPRARRRVTLACLAVIAIINLSREMNGWWYQWSEWHAPSSELDAFIRAWRHGVTAMRSVPGEHFKFLWTIYPEGDRKSVV